jgi:MSHA biogenesis protein MshP
MKKSQNGFSLVTAIFLLVVLAFLGAAMVTFSTNQHQSSAMDVMGSRAYQAARAGVEWQAFSVLRAGGACAGLTSLPPGTLGGTLSGFGVNVTCVLTTQSEVNAAAVVGVHPAGEVWVYSVTSVATQGAAGTPGYVERQIQATLAR